MEPEAIPEGYVVEVTDEEVREELAKELAELGLTWPELKEQARLDEFDSAKARRVWFVFSSFRSSLAT